VGSELNRIAIELLEEGRLVLPKVECASGGLEVVNKSLDRLRRGEIAEGRLVVVM
jgi:hypothetical protein